LQVPRRGVLAAIAGDDTAIVARTETVATAFVKREAFTLAPIHLGS